MRTYTTTAVTVSSPDLPDEVVEFAQAMAGEKSVDLAADRLMIVKECAFEIEREAGRLFWDGPGSTARRAESWIDLPMLPVLLDACPVFPNTAGADVTIVSVDSWNEETPDWETFSTNLYKRRSGGRIHIPRASVSTSEYSTLSLRIIADILPLDGAPEPAVEALGRLFALRENRRPGAGAGGLDADGRILNLDNAMRRSGARDILGTLQLGWPV